MDLKKEEVIASFEVKARKTARFDPCRHETERHADCDPRTFGVLRVPNPNLIQDTYSW